MVTIAAFELAPDVVWIGRCPGEDSHLDGRHHVLTSRETALEAIEVRPW